MSTLVNFSIFQEITLLSTQERTTYESTKNLLFVNRCAWIGFSHDSYTFFCMLYSDLFRKPLERIARYILAMDVSSKVISSKVQVWLVRPKILKFNPSKMAFSPIVAGYLEIEIWKFGKLLSGLSRKHCLVKLKQTTNAVEFSIQDLIKYTPEEHPDYRMLQEFMKHAQDFLETSCSQQSGVDVRITYLRPVYIADFCCNFLLLKYVKEQIIACRGYETS